MVSFVILAVVAVVSALMVVTRPNPMHSALWLLVTFISIAGIYLQLNAEFIAAVQIIVYAGGVLVLYIFVIMLVDLSKEASMRSVFHQPTQFVLAIVFAAAVLIAIVLIGQNGITQIGFTSVTAESATDSTRQVAQELFLKYLYPFEIASVLLLVAMIGAVVLARRSFDSDDSAEEN